MSITINGSGSITGLSNIQTIQADDIEFLPIGNIAATTVQAAIAEIDVEKATVSTLAQPSGAASVGYLPPGTGSVSTTTQDKLRQIVSIADFGNSLTTAFTNTSGAEGNGYGATPVVIDLLGITITFTGVVYVPVNVSLVNGKISSSTGRLVFRNPYIANTALRGYTDYWQYMHSSNSDVVFDCITVINLYIGAKFKNCEFYGLVFVNSNSLWTEYNSFDRCAFTQNATIGAAIRFDGNKSGTSTYSTGTGAGTPDGSFGYNNFESNCKVDSTAPTVGLGIVDGATLYNAHLGFQGYSRGAGPSGGFMFIDSSINTSTVSHCVFELHLESFGEASNILSISTNSRFWYNTGYIQSASPEMVMSQDASVDLRANSISVVGAVLQDSGGNVVFNGPGYMTRLVAHSVKREWTTPAFSVYATSDQTITSNVDTLISLGSEEFDTNTNFSTSRFTPTVAGYYQINAQAKYSATGTVSSAVLHIYKNGVPYRTSSDIQALATSIVRTISTTVYMNGSSDYLEIYANVFDNSAAPAIKGGIQNTFLDGCLIRTA